MALPPGVRICGVSRIDISQQGEDGRDGYLYVELMGTDGITYSTWWGQDDLARFVRPIREAQTAPIGATRQ